MWTGCYFKAPRTKCTPLPEVTLNLFFLDNPSQKGERLLELWKCPFVIRTYEWYKITHFLILKNLHGLFLAKLTLVLGITFK